MKGDAGGTTTMTLSTVTHMAHLSAHRTKATRDKLGHIHQLKKKKEATQIMHTRKYTA